MPRRQPKRGRREKHIPVGAKSAPPKQPERVETATEIADRYVGKDRGGFVEAVRRTDPTKTEGPLSAPIAALNALSAVADGVLNFGGTLPGQYLVPVPEGAEVVVPPPAGSTDLDWYGEGRAPEALVPVPWWAVVELVQACGPALIGHHQGTLLPHEVDFNVLLGARGKGKGNRGSISRVGKTVERLKIATEALNCMKKGLEKMAACDAVAADRGINRDVVYEALEKERVWVITNFPDLAAGLFPARQRSGNRRQGE